MNKITNEELDGLIKSAVNSSGPLPPDDKFSKIILALRELRELRCAMLKAQPVSEPYKLPSGYALVPAEPTAGMLNVGISEAMKLNANVRIVYQAMLAAAPAQESE